MNRITAFSKVEFLEGRLGASLCIHPNLRFLQYSLSLKLFANLLGNSYTKSVMLDISFRFICGESDQLKH